MKKILQIIMFACLTFLSAANGLSVMAGGCSSHRSKATDIKCDLDDNECYKKNNEKFDLNEEIKS